MLDWNGNGGRDSFDRQMDYHMVNETSGNHSRKQSDDSGKRFVYWVITAYTIELILMNLILGIENGGIVSALLAIPLSSVAYSLDNLFGKKDATSISNIAEQTIAQSLNHPPKVYSTMPKVSSIPKTVVEQYDTFTQTSVMQDIQVTDYGKVLYMGQDVFIFRAKPKYSKEPVNINCKERDALIYWSKGQRNVIEFINLAACELFIGGERVKCCIAKSVASNTKLLSNRYIPRPYNGITLFTTDGNSRAITLYADEALLYDLFNAFDYVIADSCRQSPFEHKQLST